MVYLFFLSPDLCVVPMPWDEVAAKSSKVNLKIKTDKDYNRLGEGTAFRNKTLVFPNHDVIIYNRWRKDTVRITSKIYCGVDVFKFT